MLKTMLKKLGGVYLQREKNKFCVFASQIMLRLYIAPLPPTLDTIVITVSSQKPATESKNLKPENT